MAILRVADTLSKIVFTLWLPVASTRGELEMYRPANVMERHAVGPQPAYKTFEDILIVLFGSIVVVVGVFVQLFCHFFNKTYLCSCLIMMLNWCCVTNNIKMSCYLYFYLSYSLPLNFNSDRCLFVL